MTARFPTASQPRLTRRNRLFQFVRFRLSRKLWATYRMRTGPLVRGAMALLLSGIGVFSFAQSAGTAPAVASPQVALPTVPTLIQAPSGGKVVSGTATITTPDASSTLVKQSSDRAVIDWQRFSIPKNYTVTFQQPDAKSVTLNRVVGDAPTWIAGQLKANGNVFLLNTNGVYFSATAKVDTGSLLVSALSADATGFDKASGLKLDGAGKGGAVVNEGQITVAQGGTIAMVGAQVGNTGTLSAPGGQVAMIAADRVAVDQIGDGMMKFAVERGAVGALVSNAGTVSAQGGQVQIEGASLSSTLSTVVNQTGTVRASALEQVGGKILLRAQGGDLLQAGVVEANGQGSQGQGGQVRLLGERVALLKDSVTSASGQAQGGTVLVGGGYQGRGEVQNSSYTQAQAGATVDVSAGDKGRAGTAVLWSDGTTLASATILARGGVSGGQVEVSGKRFLSIEGLDLRSSAGGQLLLDPADVEICSSGCSLTGGAVGGVFTYTANGTSTLRTSDLDSVLNSGGNVTITTADGSVTFTGTGQTWNPTINTARGSLTVNAGTGISFASGFKIISLAKPLDITLNAGTAGSGGVTMNANNTLTLNGGNLTVSAAGNVELGTVNASALNVTLSSGNLTQLNTLNISGITTIDASAGDVTLTQSGNSFGNRVNVIGNAVSVVGTGNLKLGNIDALSDLSATGATSVTQDTGTTVSVGGTASFATSGSGSVTLANTGNTFSGDVSFTNVGAASVRAGGALSLGASSGLTSLTAQSGGAMTQSGNLAVTGDVTLTSTGDITLDRSGNSFGGNVAATGVNVSLVDSTALQLGDVTATGTFTASSVLGIAQQANKKLTITGTSTFSADATHAVLLNRTANAFTGAVSVNQAQSATVAATGPLILGASSNLGSLTVTSTGAVTQSGAISTTGNVDVTATGSAITLNHVGNSLGGVVTLTGSNVSVVDSTALTLGDVTATGTFSAGSVLGITQESSTKLTVTGTSAFSADATHDVTLDRTVNSLGGAVAISATRDANVQATGTLTAGDITVGRNLQLGATGAIAQQASSSVQVTGTTQLSAGSTSAISLNQTTNQLGGAVSVTAGRDLTLSTSGALSLGSTSTLRNVSLTAGSDIQQTAGLTATGTVSATSTGGQVTLDHVANAITGAVSASGTDLTINNTSALVLGTVAATGTLSVASDNGITQAAGGTVSAGGLSHFSADNTHDVVLNNTGNALTGRVDVSSVRDATLRTGTALQLGQITTQGNLVATSTGSLTQAGSTQLNVAGTTQLTTTGATADLTLGSGNTLTGAVSLSSGRDLSVTSTGALTLDALNVTGQLTLSAGGAISQTAAWAVGGATSLTSTSQGAVTLNQAGNAFQGALALNAGGVSLTNSVATVLGQSTLTGTLNVDSTNGVSQQAATSVSVLGNASVTAGTSADVTLDATGNQFSSLVTVTQARDVTLTNAAALQLGTVNAARNVVLQATGNVAQSGALTVGGTTSATATGGQVTLSQAGNALTGAISASGTQVTLRNSLASVLGTINTGNLNVTSTLGMSQAVGSTVTATGTVTLTADSTHDVLLTRNNSLSGLVSVTAARDISLNTTGALQVDLASVRDITLSATGAITQATTLNVGRNLSATSTTGQVTLQDAGNVVGGQIDASGTQVALRTVGDMLLGSVSSTGNFTAQSIGHVTQANGTQLAITGTTTVIVDSTHDVLLGNSGNALGSSVSVAQSRDLTLNTGTALQLGATSVSRNLSLSSAGDLTQTAAWTVGGTTQATSTGGKVLLSQAGNALSGVVSASGTDVNLRSSGNLVLDQVAAAGALTLQSGGHISQQTGSALSATGSTTATADGSHDVLLDKSANQLAGAVTATGRQVTLANGRATVLGQVQASQGLTVNSTGNITQQGASTLQVTGNVGLTASGATAGITVGNANTVTGEVSLSAGGNVSYTTSGAAQMGSVTAGGNLGLTAGGAVTQSGDWQVTGTTQVQAAGADITLSRAGNQLGGAVTLTGRHVNVRDASALTLGQVTASGNLTLQGSGISQQNGTAVTATGTATLTADATHDVVLGQATNSWGGAVSVTAARGVTLRSSAGLATGTLNAQGNVSLTTAGDLSQSAAWSVQGTTTIDAGSNQVSLDQSTNSLTGAVSLTAGAVDLRAGSALLLGNVSAASLQLQALGGASQQTGTALTVTGATTLAADATHDLILNRAGNQLGGAITVGAVRDLSLANTGALQLGSLTVGRDLTLSATGALGQTGGWSVGGDTQLSSGGAVTVDRSDNSFAGSVGASGTQLSLRNTGDLALYGVSTSGALNVQATGHVTQRMGGSLQVGGTTTVATDASHDITLNNAGNVLQGEVALQGHDLQLFNGRATQLAAVTASRDLAVESSGTLTQKAGTALSVGGDFYAAALDSNADLVLNGANSLAGGVRLTAGRDLTVSTSSALALNALQVGRHANLTASGAVTQGAGWQVGGDTQVQAAGFDVTLDRGDNQLQGAVSVTGAQVTVNNTGALTLGAITATQGLAVQADGGVSQRGGTALAVTGNVSAGASATGDVKLDAAANQWGGSVTVSAARDVSLAKQGALAVGAVTASRDVVLQGQGDVTQTGAISAGGTTSATSATGLVNLGLDGNSLAGAVTLSGTQVSVKNGQALVLGNVDASGVFTAASLQGLSQQAGTRVSATAGSVLSADATHDIVLDRTANVLGGNVSVGAARHVTLATGTALQLGSVSLSGNLGLQATGDITQTSALTVAGQTSAQSSGGQVLLNQAANQFAGQVSASGTRLDVQSASALQLGSLQSAGDVRVVSAGSVAQSSGAISAGGVLSAQSGAGTALNLGASGNQVTGAVTLTGGDVTWTSNAATVLGDVRASGQFQAQTQGSLTQQSGSSIQAGGVASLDAAGAGQDLVLNQANVFSQGVALSAGRDVKVSATGGLLVRGGAVGRDLVIQAGGAVTQNAALSVVGQTQVSAAGQDVLLTQAGNQLQGQVTVQAAKLDLASQGNVQLGALDLSGTLGVKAGGGITQTAAAQVAGLSRFEAGQDLTLTQATNQFNGGVQVAAARDVSLTQQGALSLAGVQATGQLAVNAQGAVTQSAALNVGGTTSVQAAGQTVTLTDAANQLQGAVGITAQQAQLRNQGSLVLGASQLTGAFSVQSGGAVSQAAGLSVGGAVQLTAAQDVTLTSSANQFSAGLTVQTGGNLALTNQGETQLTLPELGGNLTLQSGGRVTQGGAWLVNGSAQVTALGSNMMLNNAGNLIKGPVTLSGSSVSLALAGDGVLGTLNVDSLIFFAQGKIQLGGGQVNNSLNLLARGSSITQTAGSVLTVNGLTTLNTGGTGGRGAVTLTQAANRFNGGLRLSQTGATQLASSQGLTVQGDADSLSLASTSAITFGDTQVKGALTVDAQGAAIAQQASTTLKVGGDASLKSVGGTVTLQSAGNQLAGKVDVQASTVALAQDAALALGQVKAGQLDVRSATALDLGTGRVDGQLTAVASQGNVTQQAGGLSVGGEATVQATQGQVILGSAQNQWQGGVNLSGQSALVRAQGDLTVNSATTQGLDVGATGQLSLGQVAVQGELKAQTQGGLVRQVNGTALSVSGATTVDSQGAAATAGAVQLTQAGNQFGGAVNLKSGATQVAAAGALTLGSVQTGALTVGSQGALNLGQGRVQGDLSATTQGAAITQATAGTAALVVDGNANLDAQGAAAKAASITLTQAGNDFKGTVSAKGDPVSLTDANSLKTGSITASTVNLDSTGELSLGAIQAATVQAVTHGGAVTQTAALKTTTTLAIDTAAKPGLVIKNSATPTAVTGAGAITLTDAGNQLQGVLKLAGANTQVSSQGNLVLDSLNLQAGSTATFTAQNTVSTVGAIDLGGASLSLKGQTVQLGGALTAASLAIDAGQPLVLNRDITLSGDLQLKSAGAISQSAGALSVKGLTSVDVGQSTVALTQAGNDFGQLSVKAQGAQVVDRGGLTLTGTSVKTLDVQSDGQLVLAGATVSGDAKLVAAGISQQAGVLSVAGQFNATTTGAAGLVLTQSGNQLSDVVLKSASRAQLSTDAVSVKADVMQVKGDAVLNMAKASSLSLQAGTFQGNSLTFQYDPAVLKPAGISLTGGTAIILGPQTSYFRESELGSVYSSVNILDGNITRICLGDGAGLDQCMPPAAASRLLPLISVVIAGEEQVAQRRAAGLGGVLRRLRSNTISLDELKAPLEYRNVPEAKRVSCAKEQAEGQTDQACAR